MFNFFRKNEQKTKTSVNQEYIENAFSFLIDSGYNYKFYQKNWEKEFIYSLGECCIEIYLTGSAFDCIVRTKDFSRCNISKSPIASEHFKQEFTKSNSIKRIDMTIDLLHENANIFGLE